MMEQRALGSTGIRVSSLGLGTVKFGRNQGVKYPQGFELPDDQTVLSLLRQAQEAGINLLDTAPAYGSSEERLGQLLAERDYWVLCTKVGEEFEAGHSEFRFDRDSVTASVERSLRRLKTDYLDLVLIHSNGEDKAILDETDCLDALRRCQERGLVRAIGLSSKTVEGGLHALALTDAVMVTVNRQHHADKPVIERARELNKGVLVKKALESGHSQNPQNALRYAIEFPGVSSVIVGTLSRDHLASNIATASLPTTT